MLAACIKTRAQALKEEEKESKQNNEDDKNERIILDKVSPPYQYSKNFDERAINNIEYLSKKKRNLE